MDVDDNSRTNQSATILVHPLAIVNISDQYTRIVCGGSPLDPSTPVTGLLFGTSAIDNKTNNNNNSNNSNDKNNTIIVIRDAAEDNIYTSSSSRAHQQVSLHQAVFAQHKVVGWYRVAAAHEEQQEEGPTVEDLMRTKQLIQDHCQQQQEPSQQNSFVFALLQVPENKKKESTAASNNNKHVQNNELPLSLYMLDDDKNALLAMEDWKLDTAEVERVALERVVREEMSSSNNNNNKVLSKIDQLQESFSEIQNRMDILYAFLNDTHTGQIPSNHALLRQAYGVLLLLQQLGAKQCSARGGGAGGTESAQELQDKAGHEQQEEYALLQQLAAVTKTITAVQAYADKFRVTGTDFAVVVGKTAAAAAAAGAGGAGTASSSRDSRRF